MGKDLSRAAIQRGAASVYNREDRGEIPQRLYTTLFNAACNAVSLKGLNKHSTAPS